MIFRSVIGCFFDTWLLFVFVFRFVQINDGSLLEAAVEEQVCHFLGGSEDLRCPLISQRSSARISTSIRQSPSTPKVTHFLLTFSILYIYCVHAQPGCVPKPSALPT